MSHRWHTLAHWHTLSHTGTADDIFDRILAHTGTLDTSKRRGALRAASPCGWHNSTMKWAPSRKTMAQPYLESRTHCGTHCGTHRGTHWHIGTLGHWHPGTLPFDAWLGLLEDDVLTLPVSGTAHHKSEVGLLPSKVRLLSKVLLEATSLLASYVLVNTSSPPARGDGTEESRAES